MKSLVNKTILACFLILTSCKKEPGIGGNSSIQGHIDVHHYNASFSQLLGIYPAADHYVYIVYGSHNGYDKRIKTDYDGNFEFNYLYPGDYSIYTYSLDSTGMILSGQSVIKQDVHLGKKEAFQLQSFVVYE